MHRGSDWGQSTLRSVGEITRDQKLKGECLAWCSGPLCSTPTPSHPPPNLTFMESCQRIFETDGIFAYTKESLCNSQE